jgi:hypothetical protein
MMAPCPSLRIPRTPPPREAVLGLPTTAVTTSMRRGRRVHRAGRTQTLGITKTVIARTVGEMIKSPRHRAIWSSFTAVPVTLRQ